MNHASTLLAARHERLQTNRRSSIEGNASNNTSSIELPAEVDALIDDKRWLPRYKKLMREYPRQLVAWAEVARNQQQPSRYFAKGCKVGVWEDRTVKFLAKLVKVQQVAERVAQKLRIEVTKFIYQQIWRGVNVERWADVAAEVGRQKAKYFAWLCKREEPQAAGWRNSAR